MLEALILTLREGFEAALVVGIIVTFLRREGRGGELVIAAENLRNGAAAFRGGTGHASTS